MSGIPNSDREGERRRAESRVAVRRKRTEDEIVAAAWDLVRADGLTSVSMRELGDRVGMKAQSLYSYFASKNDIYDAMFREGQIAFAEAMAMPDDDVEPGEPMRARLRLVAKRFFDFCTADTARYQLMFQRVIPDFEPSPESYALAVDQLEKTRARMRAAGFDSDRHLDLWTAMLTGLVDQQISNDPGGTRWQRLIGDAVDMFFAFATATSTPTH